MANPRQRNKARSKKHNAVKTTSKTNSKKVVVRGPPALVASWDKKKTVLQNYKALGLLPSLAPHAAGGIEKTVIPLQYRPSRSSSSPSPEPSSSNADPNYIPAGYGRIVRDAEGNVIDIIMSTEEPKEEDGGEGMPGEGTVKRDLKGKGKETEFVKELESYAATSGPLRAPPRTCTSSELTFLLSLHAKYGTDLQKASRDIRLNRLQKTKGELERSLKRAGGWAGVLDYGREVADVLNV